MYISGTSMKVNFVFAA